MQLLAILLSFLVGNVCAFVIFRRYRLISWIFLLIVPIALIPFWIKTTYVHNHWFYWAKFFLIEILILFFLLVQSTSLKKKNWPFHLIYWNIIFNLLELIIVSISFNFWGSYAIVIGGIFLILSFPRSEDLKESNQGKGDFLCDLPYSWICAYSLWTVLFFYSTFPHMTGIYITIILAPLFISIMNRKLWLMSRIYTIAFYLICSFAFPQLGTIANTAHWKNEFINTIAPPAVFCMILICTFNTLSSLRKFSRL